MKLVPCAACHRHVRVDDAMCPFCDASMAGVTTGTLGPLRERSRAAFVFFASAALVGCGKDAAQKPPIDAAPTVQAPTPDLVQPYGVPVMDPANAPVPAYGVPPPDLTPTQTDAGVDAGRAKPKSKPKP